MYCIYLDKKKKEEEEKEKKKEIENEFLTCEYTGSFYVRMKKESEKKVTEARDKLGELKEIGNNKYLKKLYKDFIPEDLYSNEVPIKTLELINKSEIQNEQKKGGLQDFNAKVYFSLNIKTKFRKSQWE